MTGFTAYENAISLVSAVWLGFAIFAVGIQVEFNTCFKNALTTL